MKLVILDFCDLPEQLRERHGSIGGAIERWLAPHLPEATLEIAHVAGGASLPTVSEFDGYILSGSEKGVYDDAEWMEPLREFLGEARDAGAPLFGICFGHQIMADAFGGKAAKSNTGFAAGVRRMSVHDADMHVHVMHQDQVIAAPPGAAVIGSSAYCPIAALEYDFPARSIQFHPEYDAEFMMDATNMLDGAGMTAAEAEHARRTMADAVVSKALYGAEVATFFRKWRA